jgi:hypothetical protein
MRVTVMSGPLDIRGVREIDASFDAPEVFLERIEEDRVGADGLLPAHDGESQEMIKDQGNKTDDAGNVVELGLATSVGGAAQENAGRPADLPPSPRGQCGPAPQGTRRQSGIVIAQKWVLDSKKDVAQLG